MKMKYVENSTMRPLSAAVLVIAGALVAGCSAPAPTPDAIKDGARIDLGPERKHDESRRMSEDLDAWRSRISPPPAGR